MSLTTSNFSTKLRSFIVHQPKSRPIHIFFFIICSSVLFSLFANDIISRTKLIQHNTSTSIKLHPYYGYLAVPSSVNKNNPRGSLGSDFSQVYYSSKAVRNGYSPYTTTDSAFKDGSNRPPNYPPFTNWLYAQLPDFPYPLALLSHTYITIIVFFIVSIFTLFCAGSTKHIGRLLLIYILLYFYTTLGYAHFERGQFDLWTASFFTTIFTCMYLSSKKIITPLLAGFFGAIKWSSLPFLGTFSLLALLGTDNRKRWELLIVYAAILASVSFFLSDIRLYFNSLKIYEFNAPVIGISFEQIFPKTFAKSIQITSALVVASFFVLKTNQKNKKDVFRLTCLPFAIAMAVQGMCYGTISYEYRVVSLLGLIPALFVWIEKEEQVPQVIKLISATVFALFLVISFRVFHFYFFSYPTIQPTAMVICYLITSIVFILLSIATIIYTVDMHSRKSKNTLRH